MFLLNVVFILSIFSSLAFVNWGKVCMRNGITYENGANITRDKYNCYGLLCVDGQIVAWDANCSFVTPPCPGGMNVRILGQCCPKCMGSIMTTTPPWTPPYVNPFTKVVNTSLTSTEKALDNDSMDETHGSNAGCHYEGMFFPYGSEVKVEDKCSSCMCLETTGVTCESMECSRDSAKGNDVEYVTMILGVFSFYQAFDM